MSFLSDLSDLIRGRPTELEIIEDWGKGRSFLVIPPSKMRFDLWGNPLGPKRQHGRVAASREDLELLSRDSSLMDQLEGKGIEFVFALGVPPKESELERLQVLYNIRFIPAVSTKEKSVDLAEFEAGQIIEWDSAHWFLYQRLR